MLVEFCVLAVAALEGEAMQFDPSPVAQRLRKLHRAGHLTHAQYVVGDTLLWSCRAPGRDDAQVSYKRLAKMAAVGYRTTVGAIAAMIRLGVLTKQKTRLRVAWSLGVASRQWRNIYRLIAVQRTPRTEFRQDPTDRVEVRKKVSVALQEALDRLGSAIPRASAPAGFAVSSDTGSDQG